MRDLRVAVGLNVMRFIEGGKSAAEGRLRDEDQGPGGKFSIARVRKESPTMGAKPAGRGGDRGCFFNGGGKKKKKKKADEG